MYNLNPEQLRAVKHLGTPLLVLAGAGSGKTSVITHKIAYLIKECAMNPKSIAAVTFTNKAAAEMVARVSNNLGRKLVNGLSISTFHTLGWKIIKAEYKDLGYKTNITIYDQEDCLLLLQELALGSDEYLDKIEFYLACISKWKGAAISPNEAATLVNTAKELRAAKLYISYQAQLKCYNVVDFDDLILLPLQLLQSNASIKDKYQLKIHYLLIDEYQDTNTAQYKLIKELVGIRAAFTAVGDDHQSVYAWRGANPENLFALETHYPNLTVIKLEQNYRSTARILQAANSLIKNNDQQYNKNLWSTFGAGEKVKIVQCKDRVGEANFIARQILNAKLTSARKYSDHAILFRSNHQAKILEEALREYKIPYQLFGGVSFFMRSEVKDLLAYLKILINPDDDGAFLRIINRPKRGIGPSTLKILSEYAKNRQISLFAACFEYGLTQMLSEKQLLILTNFVNWINVVADNAMRGNSKVVIIDYIKDIKYKEWLGECEQHPKACERKIQNIQELEAWLLRLLEKNSNNFAAAINSMILTDIIDNNAEKSELDAVKLLTLHAAKGMEYSFVYISGMEEEILPHKNSIIADNISEERRLAYVGITRAKSELTFTIAKNSKRYLENIVAEPSRFLAEIDPLVLEWIDLEKKQIRTPEKGKSHLASIREILQQTNTGQ